MTEFGTSPKFVTPDDFFNYTGRDLRAILKPNDNISNSAELFLKNIEDDLMFRVDKLSFRLYPWDNLCQYQLDCMKRAVIKQAEYVLRNSDIMTDSGYDIEKGRIISRAELEEIALCPATIDALNACGLLNHVIRNHPRFPRTI